MKLKGNIMFNFLKPKYGGHIKYFNLTEFWDSLSENERKLIRFRDFLGMSGCSQQQVDKGNTDFETSETLCQFLQSLAAGAINEKAYNLADKLFNEAEKRAENCIDTHYLYLQMINYYYKRREDASVFIDKCIEICKKDIELFPEYKKAIIEEEINQKKARNERRGKPETPIKPEDYEWHYGYDSFDRLRIIYKKQKEYDKAIEVCKLAVSYGHEYFNEEIIKLEKLKNK